MTTPAGLVLVLAMAAPAMSSSVDFEQLSSEAARARDANHADEAIRLYRQALEQRPSWKEGLWYLGTLLYDRERFEEARNTLRRFVVYDPDAGPGWVVLGMCEFQTREYARALPHLQRGVAQGLGDREEMERLAWYFTGVLLTRFERFDESMPILVNPRLTGPRNERIMEAVGVAALRMPLLPAETPADRREMVSGAGEGASAFASHDDEKAAALLRQLVVAYPKEPGVHFLYGAFLMKSLPEEGIAEMRRELEVSPDHIPARIQLASEYLREEKPDEALPPARQAVDLDPGASDTHLALGQTLVSQGNFTEGIRELEIARDRAPRVLQAHWALSKAYFAAGRKTDGEREAAEMERLRAETRKSEGSR